MQTLPVIGVMGSGRDGHHERSQAIGRWIAEAGFHLLTGGGAGVMAAVTEAFVGVTPRLGMAIAVLPADTTRGDGAAPPGYPNRWVEVAIRTHLVALGRDGELPTSRNHVNVLSSDVVIVLPGGEGTASEARLAVRYERPCVAFVDDRDDVPGLPASIPIATTVAEVARFVATACGRA